MNSIPGLVWPLLGSEAVLSLSSSTGWGRSLNGIRVETGLREGRESHVQPGPHYANQGHFKPLAICSGDFKGGQGQFRCASGVN